MEGQVKVASNAVLKEGTLKAQIALKLNEKSRNNHHHSMIMNDDIVLID
jgi:hypothetical protein